MQENRHYYYMKLKDNFYDRGTIRILEREKDGFFKIILYQRLCLLSLENSGLLMLNADTPYTEESLAAVLGFEEERVKESLKSIIKLGLLERLEDGRFYVTDIELMVGQSSTEGERKKKERLKLLRTVKSDKNTSSAPENQPVDKCPPISEIEKEKEKEIKIESEKKPELKQEPKREPEPEPAQTSPVSKSLPEKTVRPEKPAQSQSANHTPKVSLPDQYGMRGPYHNVFLTDEAYRELEKHYPNSLHTLIDCLSQKLYCNPIPVDPVKAIFAMANKGNPLIAKPH